MWGVIACIFCWAIVLSVPTITTESIRSSASGRIEPQTLTLREAQPMQMPPTGTDSWNRLEAESSPLQRSDSTIKRQIETAKYNPDTGVIAVLETNSPGEPDDPHVKVGLDQEETDKKPRLAVRFIIPFGN
jgi:hypothetical protein